MPTQIGHIDLSASNAVKLYAEAGFESAEETYSTKSELQLAVDGITTRVSEVETDVDGLGTRMSAAESSITQNATAISSKVSQTDYTGATIASLINQSASTVTIQAAHVEIDGEVTFSAIQSYADAAYDALGAADAIEVGGRNLLPGTGDFSGWYRSSGVTAEGDTTTFPAQETLAWLSTACPATIPAGEFYGQAWTLSFDYRSDEWDATGNPYIWVEMDGTATEGATARTKFRRVSNDNTLGTGGKWVPTTEWQRASVTVTPADESFFASGSGDVSYVNVRFYSHTYNAFQVRRPKLERGTKATDWTPAPEDVDEAIADAATTATGYITRIDDAGIEVHPATGTASNYARLDGDGFEVYRGGVSVASFGVAEQEEGSTATSYESRIGPEDSGHTVVTDAGLEVIDGDGETVATFGESISFLSSRPQRIGGEQAFVEWYDSDADGTADSLRIVGASVTIGSDETLAERLEAVAQGISDAQEAADAAGEGVADANESIEELSGSLDNLNARVSKYLSFDTEAGLTIGEVGNELSLLLTNDRISFNVASASGTEELAYASGDAFVAPTMAVTDQLRLGEALDSGGEPTGEYNWAWIPRSNGNLALKWIGD